MSASSARPEAGSLVVKRLSDYAPPDWLIESVSLEFDLDAEATIVRSRLAVKRNPASGSDKSAPFRLDGREFELLNASIDERRLEAGDYDRDESGLAVSAENLPGDSFVWRCETRLRPISNTSLEGLYVSRDVFCTQCEAEGFRKITYFPDRPDVLAVYNVRLSADKARAPVLLCNGDEIERGDLPDGRHFVAWRDPHPKPSYLFALVAGDLTATRESFKTRSGREVDLALYTRDGDQNKTSYALDALKRSMAWDEQAYGLEYDLDLFNIVAVDDFNMGAMENKSLNIFNSKYVLASPETATDRDYELIESVVAHEYFHNWTGNRITCRDWFQLCLKEGLTVFRDQQFSEDQRSAAVQRIDQVKKLRSRQFREDAGPLAHPVRPEQYVEINNFYTATVYEKGAEIVRMLHTLLGAETYRRAIDLYIERHDGEAATVEQFVACFEAASGRDLSQFFRWWRRPGTPHVIVSESYDEESGRLNVILRQHMPEPPGCEADDILTDAPLVIPFAIGFVDPAGGALSAELLDSDTSSGQANAFLLEHDVVERTYRFGGFQRKPALSLNRGFAAPVIVTRETAVDDRSTLLAHDSDPFARWEAGRSMAIDAAIGVIEDLTDGRAPRGCEAYISALGAAVCHEGQDPAFRALLLGLPGEDELAGVWVGRGGGGGARAADPDMIHAGWSHLLGEIGAALASELWDVYGAMRDDGPYSPTAKAAGRRDLKNAALAILSRRDVANAHALAAAQFDQADNMSDQMPALVALVHGGAPEADAALARFHEIWRNDSLVIGKWLGLQAMTPRPDAIDRVEALTEHGAFDWRNPNMFRALIGAFAMSNPVNFHRLDGAGYRLVADWLIRLDPVNPQTTAKLVSAFDSWRRYDETRRDMMLGELGRIRGADGLSRDMAEMIDRMLAA